MLQALARQADASRPVEEFPAAVLECLQAADESRFAVLLAREALDVAAGEQLPLGRQMIEYVLLHFRKVGKQGRHFIVPASFGC